MRKCPVCSTSGFDNIDELRQHRRDEHPERVVVCSCGRSFLEQQYMQQHLNDRGVSYGEPHKRGHPVRRRRRIKRAKPNLTPVNPCFFNSSDLTAGVSGMSIGSAMSVIHMLPSDLYALDKSNLERYIAEKIQADETFLSSCGVVIDRLSEALRTRFMPRRILKSGSLGKGTSVKGQSDVDLILMLNNYDEVGLLFRNLPSVLNELETFLRVSTIASHKETTRFSVQVTMRCGDHMHEVDILPGVDLTKMGFTTTDIFREMRDVSSDMLHEYSVSLSPLQLDIMKALPTKVKSLIRLVKYWKNDKLKGSFDIEASSFSERRINPAWPNSYALELVVLNAWLEAGHPNSFDMTRALHSVLTSLVNHSSLRVLLRGLMEYSPDMARHGPGPYIMDPVNPYNDMYHGLVNGKAFDWDLVAVKARNWLGKGLFAGVTGNTQSQW